MPSNLSALDRLRKAANLEPKKKEVELSDGSIFEMYVSPLTMAERERAQKQAKSDDANAFALQLLLSKAQDENGRKLFNAGEIDVTSIGQAVTQTAPFRTFISGFADGSGSASVYSTDDDTLLSSRMVEDVIQRQQTGAKVRLYIDRQMSGANVDQNASRSILADIILTSASFNVNPDDGQVVEIAFRPSAAPTFDLSKTA